MEVMYVFKLPKGEWPEEDGLLAKIGQLMLAVPMLALGAGIMASAVTRMLRDRFREAANRAADWLTDDGPDIGARYGAGNEE